MRDVLYIALREMRREWLATACFLAALVGGLAPLLLILALKNGVVDAMVERLVEDPANREIIALGAERHDADFFAALRARPDVGFSMPATRSINALADGLRNPVTRQVDRAVPLMPSAPGDPLTRGMKGVAVGKVVLSASLAKTLDVSAGGRVELLIGRKIAGTAQLARAMLDVASVLPPERYGRALMLLSLPDMVAIERFRDDATISPADWRAARPLPAEFASFRLYARHLEDVAPLADWLKSQGIEARPRAPNVPLLIGFRRNIALLYSVIAVLAVGGFWAAMAANLRGMVERQRVTFSLLALLGMRASLRRMVPLAQAVLLVGGGIVATLLLVLALVWAVNAAFSASAAEGIARLGTGDIAATVAIGAVLALSAGIWAVMAIDRIGSDEVLREG